jgi:SH3-like domain-containing protein
VPAAAVTPSGRPTPPSKGADETGVEVAWEVAIVRDAPRTGAVVARLPRGTKVKLGANQEGWFKIEYGTGAEGWVYRGALGR